VIRSAYIQKGNFQMIVSGARGTARAVTAREILERFVPSTPKDKKSSSEGTEARVLIYQLPRGGVVLKEWAPARGAFLKRYSAWVMAREVRHYRLLQGVPGVPRLLGKLDSSRFLLEHVDAKPIHRKLGKEILHAALDNLESVIAGIHERGFAHLDLRHKGNVLVGQGGDVWIIDLGQGLDCSRGLLRRLIFPLLRRIDRSAVTKFRARYAPDTLPPGRRKKLERAYASRGVSRVPQFGRFLLRLMSAKQGRKDAAATPEAKQPPGLS
jgi:hypothetical protein